jgi:hypothetical protein
MKEESKDNVIGLKTAGQVKDGVIVPNVPLPEGAWVLITVHHVPMPFTPEEQEEFDAWRRAGDQAFEMILKLEQEEALERGESPDEPR